MRTFDVPYVKNPSKSVFPNPPLDSLSLQEITRNYLCNKSEHKISNCRKCNEKCIYGLRALEMFFGTEQKKEEPAGPTILERARQAKLNEQKSEVSVTKNGHKYVKDWYKQAEASGDIVQWVMDTFGMARDRALAKIYNYRYNQNKKQKNQLIVKTLEEKPVQKAEAPAEEKPVEKPVEQPAETQSEKQESPIEEKLAYFMRLQDEYKKKIEEYQKLYNEAKRKGDILCNAMDIMNG